MPGVGFLFGQDADIVSRQLLFLLRVGLVGAIAQEGALERSAEEGVEAVDVVAVAGDGEEVGETALRREDQMLAHPMKVGLQRRAIAGGGQAAEALALAGAHDSADLDRMGVHNEKGGWPSARVHKAAQRRWMSGVRSVRR